MIFKNSQVKDIAFIILFSVSAFFSIFLFIEFGDSISEKILLALFALGFEFLKVYTFIHFKYHKANKHIIAMMFFIFVLIFLS